MARFRLALREGRLAMKFVGASLVGFAVDAVVLHLLIGQGLTPAWARVISLVSAMQVTFLINGLGVFRRLDLSRPWGAWSRYMLAGGFGNVCNYWIFLTLVSTHWPVISGALFALSAGSLSAAAINYAGARLIVFRKARETADYPPPE
jgi:putative flippase GtrA